MTTDIFPLVSIIVPVFKVEAYLDRCIESLVTQSLREIQIILVDDGSPDMCPKICDAWSERDDRIFVIHQENLGLGFARNAGMERATGKYIAFVDSDDYVHQDMYRILVEAANDGEYDAVFCGYEKFGNDGIKLGEERDFDEVRTFCKDEMNDVAKAFLYGNEKFRGKRFIMSVWHSIYKNTSLRFYSEREILSEDLPFQISYILGAQKIKFIPNYLYRYCYNPTSLSSNFRIDKFDSSERLHSLLHQLTAVDQTFIPWIDAEYYDRIRAICTQMVFSKNISISNKISKLRELASSDIFKNLKLGNLLLRKTWKYKAQLFLLKRNAPISLFFFIIFDKLVNKQILRMLSM